MIRTLARTALVSLALALPAPAQDAPAAAPVSAIEELLRGQLPEEAVFLPSEGLVILDPTALTLEMFKWVARPLVVFADSPNDPRFIQQMEYIEARFADLMDRDVVVIVDTDPAARSAIRTELRPRGFDLVLIGKDGLKYLRKPLPWDVREISRSIDKMPLRQQELKDSRGR